MQRSEIRGSHPARENPDYATLHPGYGSKRSRRNDGGGMRLPVLR
jgi:hypothetical protein